MRQRIDYIYVLQKLSDDHNLGVKMGKHQIVLVN